MASIVPPPRQTTPIGNEYLQGRAEVGTALFALTVLAAETRAPAKTLATLQGLQAGLREPLRLVVMGESGTGRSSLLNALFGREFCRVDDDDDDNTPAREPTKRIHVFKYGEPARDVAVSPELIERYLPIPFLRGFHLVDTPGTDTPAAERAGFTGNFLPQADLVLFVFSAASPWSPGAWASLEILQKQWNKPLALVLQQADLRDERELRTILQHLRQTAQARLGASLPVFAVSAKKALLAKTTGVDKARLWNESQFGELETFINATLGGAHGESTRRSRLRAVADTARTLLKEVAADARAAERKVAADRAGLTELRESVARWKKAARGQVQGFARGLEEAFDRCREQGERALRERLRFWAAARLALGGDPGWGAQFQRDLENTLRAAVSAQTERAIEGLEGETRDAWRQARQTLRSRFPAEGKAGGAVTNGKNPYPGLRTRLLEQIELTLAERVSDDQIERQLRAQLAAGGRTLLPGASARALAVYHERMDAKRQELANAVGDLILDAIDSFYERLAQLLVPAEASTVGEETHWRPLLERIDTLERQFAKIVPRL